MDIHTEDWIQHKKYNSQTNKIHKQTMDIGL